jgi:hypothetical protein
MNEYGLRMTRSPRGGRLRWERNRIKAKLDSLNNLKLPTEKLSRKLNSLNHLKDEWFVAESPASGTPRIPGERVVALG